MSTATEAVAAIDNSRRLPIKQWLQQILAISRIEVRRCMFGKRSVLIHLLGLLPVLLLALLAVFESESRSTQIVSDGHGNVVSRSVQVRSGPMKDPASASTVYAALFEGLIVRTVIFFGCAWIFMNLFRGDLVDRSLHYYLLSPVRREVLVLGKYVSGLFATIVLFGLSTAGSLFFFYYARGYSESLNHIFNGPGLSQIGWYMTISMLACAGYGAFFLLIGLVFRNPVIPALLMYGWEWLNFLLPPFLKKISVIHYLSSLAPVPISQGAFAIVGEPTRAIYAIPGMMLLSGLLIAAACWQIRKLEIDYGAE